MHRARVRTTEVRISIWYTNTNDDYVNNGSVSYTSLLISLDADIYALLDYAITFCYSAVAWYIIDSGFKPDTMSCSGGCYCNLSEYDLYCCYHYHGHSGVDY